MSIDNCPTFSDSNGLVNKSAIICSLGQYFTSMSLDWYKSRSHTQNFFYNVNVFRSGTQLTVLQQSDAVLIVLENGNRLSSVLVKVLQQTSWPQCFLHRVSQSNVLCFGRRRGDKRLFSTSVWLFDWHHHNLPCLHGRDVAADDRISIKQADIFMSKSTGPTAWWNKKAQLSLTNPRDACEKFARFT